jgi:peroxiredoxin 2/4
MEFEQPKLPEIGDSMLDFEFESGKGLLRFSEYAAGNWCIIFAHPANFTSAWTMFGTYIGMKERWLSARNTKLLAISNEPLRHNNDWSDKARRFIGIYMKAPVLEDLDFSLSRRFGIASGRRPQAGLDRLALITDPSNIVRIIIHRPLPNIEAALTDIERELSRLQGEDLPERPLSSIGAPECPDRVAEEAVIRPAHFPRKSFAQN